VRVSLSHPTPGCECVCQAALTLRQRQRQRRRRLEPLCQAQVRSRRDARETGMDGGGMEGRGATFKRRCDVETLLIARVGLTCKEPRLGVRKYRAVPSPLEKSNAIGEAHPSRNLLEQDSTEMMCGNGRRRRYVKRRHEKI